MVIFGCGALGTVFAKLLADAGHRVWAVCRSREHRKAIQAHGLLVIEDGKQHRVPLHGTPGQVRVFAKLPSSRQFPNAACDLVIVLVKSFDTECAATALGEVLTPSVPVLTLQNGLGNAEALAKRLKRNPILAGTTTFGAYRESPGMVRLTGRGECEIGAWNRAAEDHLKPVALLLRQCGIPCSISQHVKSVLWKKLAISATINPLTAILRVRNGELLDWRNRHPVFRVGVREVVAEVVEELRHVAAKSRIALPLTAELNKQVCRVCQLTASNYSSMYRDLELGHQTEIDAINGAVVRLGRMRRVSTPTNLVLCALVKAMGTDIHPEWRTGHH